MSQHLCIVGKKKCGCYVYAAVIEEPSDILSVSEEMREYAETLTFEFKPVQWVRDGGLTMEIHGNDLAQRQQREAGADGNPETSAPAKEGA
ncbi:MAG TPA: hypothetical protein VFI60_04650 [Candidatus Acidoferrum sp.]|nr:hypothetical protein [Candidatus Acidoferrum sp.]